MRSVLVSSAVLFFIAIVVAPSSASAQDVEIEAQLLRGSSARAFVNASPAIRLGIGLGDRVVLLTGLEAAHMQRQDSSIEWSTWYLSVPLELKVYLGQPQGTVPTLRVGASYGRSKTDREFRDGVDGSTNAPSTHVAQAHGLAGVQHFVDERFALSIEGGLGYRRAFTSQSAASDSESRELGIAWRAGFVLRL